MRTMAADSSYSPRRIGRSYIKYPYKESVRN